LLLSVNHVEVVALRVYVSTIVEMIKTWIAYLLEGFPHNSLSSGFAEALI
jgi:hypothetical protein